MSFPLLRDRGNLVCLIYLDLLAFRLILHTLGMTMVLIDKFIISVTYLVAFGPMCFSFIGAIQSGPSATERAATVAVENEAIAPQQQVIAGSDEAVEEGAVTSLVSK